MTDQERCFLETLRLTNYRCFPDVSLNFDQRLTVFVAPNGGGKTAVLDGIAVALRLFVDTMEGRPASKGFDADDIRLALNPEQKMENITPVSLEAQGQFLGTQIAWYRERTSRQSSRTTTAEAQALQAFAARLTQANQEWAERRNPESPIFPLIAYYGTGRLWSTTKLTEGKRTRELAPNARYRGYTDSLSPASRYKFFVEWFERFSLEALQEQLNGIASPHKPQQPLRAVRTAVDRALQPSGWHTLEWDVTEQTVRANHTSYGRLPVSMLSDGIRNLIGLVADMAHRTVRLNPQLGEHAVFQTPGIVLIDEVDMHLHPEWQQVILTSLQEAFPLVQFIVTTHSPQVLSTVPAPSIRMLVEHEDGNWSDEQPYQQTRGVESAYVMATVMNTDPIPPVDEARWVSEYHALIQEHRFDTDEAQALRARLESHFGSRHPIMLDFERLIRLERFKHNLPRAARPHYE